MSTSRGRKDRNERPRPVLLFLKKNWFEILAVGLLGLGVFLLVERFKIKSFLAKAFVRLVEVVVESASYVWNSIAQTLDSVEKSDIVGLVLVLLSIGMIVFSLRSRAIRNHPAMYPDTEECPECGDRLDRIHIKRSHQLMETLLRVRIRRYACRKCSFKVSAWKNKGDDE